MISIVHFALQVSLVFILCQTNPDRIVFRFMLSGLFLLGIYGLFSFAAGLIDLNIKINHLAYVVTVCLMITLAMRKLFQNAISRASKSSNFSILYGDEIYVLLIVTICLLLGMMNFGLEFTPSSMTGDPPRHFGRAEAFLHGNAAAVWKPIYPLAAAGWLGLSGQFDPVRSFTLFNALVLCGVGAFLYGVLRQIEPSLTRYSALCVACVAAAGYPQFALQYGYFGLNLAALFLFATTLALFIWYRRGDLETYFLSMILGTGVVLTHGYLLPPLLIIHSTIFIHREISGRAKLPTNAIPYKGHWLIVTLLWYMTLSILSNGWLSIASLEGQFETLKLKGLVNESFFLNITPFLPLAVLSLFFDRQAAEKKLLIYIAWLVFFYATLLFLFGLTGLIAPYYINRVQVILLPLLVILNAIVIHDFCAAFKWNSVVVFSIALAVVLGMYWSYRAVPLGFSKESFLSLLRKDEFVYVENAVNAGFSPLQLTPLDVRLLKSIQQSHRVCFDRTMTNVAVLGTDHSVEWFEHLTGIRPSLFDRSDGYIDFIGYFRNFRRWTDNADEKYIVVMSHFDFWNRGDILAKIYAQASPVCMGDTIKIYRKNSSFGGMLR